MFYFSALTKVSAHYPKNQDAVLIMDQVHTDNYWQGSGEIEQNNGVIAIADGVSSSPAPHIASKTLLSSLEKRVQLQAKENPRYRCEYLSEKLSSITRRSPHLYGTTTTLVAMEWENNRCVIYHVGDSRAYLIKTDSIEQLTTDHSIAQELLDSCEVSQQEFDNLGNFYQGLDRIFVADPLEDPPVPSIYSYELQSDEMILLCSDGLNCHLSNDEIFNCINANDLELSLNNLDQMVAQRGREDDLSIVLFKHQRA